MYLNKDYTESGIHPVLWNSLRRRVGLRQLSGLVIISQLNKRIDVRIVSIGFLIGIFSALFYISVSSSKTLKLDNRSILSDNTKSAW